MTDPCTECKSGRTVPVLDKRIERSPRAGNKYRCRCLACGRWQPMISEQAFRNHRDPHILPVDADPEGDVDDVLVPLVEYDYGPELEDLAERVEDSDADDRDEAETDDVDEPVETPPQTQQPDGPEMPADTNEKRAMTDGGEDVEEEDDPVNQFECPATGCGEVVEGYPDECPACGAPYDWEDRTQEADKEELYP